MQPQNPNPDFNFILKNDQPAKRGLPTPNLPKWAKISLAVVAGLIILIIISSVLSGRKNSNNQVYANVLARNAETLRVTALVQQLRLRDPQTQALAATVTGTFTSDQIQMTNYLAKLHIKVSSVQLASVQDKSTDANLQTASQNNSLDSAYADYLKTAIAKYQTDLQDAYKAAGPNGKTILSSSYDSTKALLATAPLKG
jgi:hypothetical protein